MKPSSSWQDRVVSAAKANGSRFGCILMCALGRVPDAPPQFHGKASITSDGFLMCDFTDTAGTRHAGAFVGSVFDLQANMVGISDHLNLSEPDRVAFLAVMQAWIGLDYRDQPLVMASKPGDLR